MIIDDFWIILVKSLISNWTLSTALLYASTSSGEISGLLNVNETFLFTPFNCQDAAQTDDSSETEHDEEDIVTEDAETKTADSQSDSDHYLEMELFRNLL